MLNFSGFRNVKWDAADATRLVRSFGTTRLVFVGDLMLDRYLRGTVRRVSPEAPVPILEVSEETQIPGGMGNACANAHSLGGLVLPLGIVGDDEPGELLIAELAARGIDTSGIIRDPNRRTTVKTRVVADSQQIVRLDVETPHPVTGSIESRLAALIEDALRRAAGLVLCDYAKGLLTPLLLRRAIAAARRAGALIAVDPKRPNFRAYREATIITPNIKEAQAAVGTVIRSDAGLLRAGRRLLAQTSSDYVLITLGEHGMALFGEPGGPCAVASEARQVFDVTGAGDTAIAALSLSLAAGGGASDAMALANIAAGLKVEKRGTAVVTVSELLTRLVPAPPVEFAEPVSAQ